MANLNRNEKDGLIYYTVPAFERTGLVKHAFTTRLGGFSREAYESLNLSILTDDLPENVLKNREKLANILGFSPGELVGSWQVHGDKIHLVTSGDKGRGASDPHTVIPDTDGLITQAEGVFLIAFFADCVPLLFLDPVNKAIGIAHAGWKGTVAGIGGKTVLAMKSAFGTKPDRLIVTVGPSIGACHYQVDEPVLKRFREEFPSEYQELISCEDSGGHAWLDLWKANVLQLIRTGVAEENISVAGICTQCMQNEFFSHRAGDKGRHAALISLQSSKG